MQQESLGRDAGGVLDLSGLSLDDVGELEGGFAAKVLRDIRQDEQEITASWGAQI